MQQAAAMSRFDMSAGDADEPVWELEGVYGSDWAADFLEGADVQVVCCTLPCGVSSWSAGAGGAISYAAGALLVEESANAAGGAISYAGAVESGSWQLPGQANRWATADAAVGAVEVPSTSSTVAPVVCGGPSVCAAHFEAHAVCEFCGPNILAKHCVCHDKCEEAGVLCTLDALVGDAGAGGAISYAAGALLDEETSYAAGCGAISYAGCGAISGDAGSLLAAENEFEGCGTSSYAVGALPAVGFSSMPRADICVGEGGKFHFVFVSASPGKITRANSILARDAPVAAARARPNSAKYCTHPSPACCGASSYAGCGAISGSVASVNELEGCGAISCAGCGAISYAGCGAVPVEKEVESCGAISGSVATCMHANSVCGAGGTLDGASSYAGCGAISHAGCGAIAGAVASLRDVENEVESCGAISGSVAMGSLWCSCFGISRDSGGGKFQKSYFVFVFASPGKITRANFESMLAGAVATENAYADDGAISLEVWAVGGVTEIPAEPG
jgi:hypothetical protein